MSSGHMDRRDVARKLLAARGNALVVTGLGSTCYDAGAVADHPLTFYFWGGMGAAAMSGLGLALAQKNRPVLVLTGDGEMLLGLGALATLGTQGPPNLAIVVIDNELYSETGMQKTHTARGLDMAGMAKAAGFKRTATIRTEAELDDWIPRLYQPDGVAFVAIKVNDARYPLTSKVRDGSLIKNRFREALLGPAALE